MRILVFFIIGVLVLVVFVVWEWKGVSYFMVLRDMGKLFWILWLIFIIMFILGVNFFLVLMIWLSEVYNVYGYE